MDYSINQNSQNVQPQQPEPKKHISTWLGLAIIIAVVIIAFGGVFAYQYFSQPDASQPEEIIQDDENQTAGWKTYINDNLGFSFDYPQEIDAFKEYSVELQDCAHKEKISNSRKITNTFYAYILALGSTNNLTIDLICDRLTSDEINFHNNPPYWNDSVTEINISGEKAYEHYYVTSTGYINRIVQIPLGDMHFIEIAYTFGNANRLNKVGYEFKNSEWNQMLSTFKFTK